MTDDNFKGTKPAIGANYRGYTIWSDAEGYWAIRGRGGELWGPFTSYQALVEAIELEDEGSGR